MRILVVCIAFLYGFSLHGQSTIEEAYIAVTDSSIKRPLLEFIYGNVTYPKVARTHGTTALIKVDYTILRDGSVNVDSIRILSPESISGSISQENLIKVVAYIENGTFVRKKPKPGTKRYERYVSEQLAGEKALLTETLRIFKNLPDHVPAKVNDVALNRSYWKLISFQLE
ncbi:hypothetical protein CEQ90_04965 [Lewinellaceae bacterium SD302]|nr:hypothetical protein CEQ90_04965 [Lewinellaceae bacterium SD302]